MPPTRTPSDYPSVHHSNAESRAIKSARRKRVLAPYRDTTVANSARLGLQFRERRLGWEGGAGVLVAAFQNEREEETRD